MTSLTSAIQCIRLLAVVVFTTNLVERYNALGLAKRKPSGIILARWYLFVSNIRLSGSRQTWTSTQQSQKGELVHLLPGEKKLFMMAASMPGRRHFDHIVVGEL